MSTNRPGRKPSLAGHNTPSVRAREAIAAALCLEVHSWRLSQAKAAARLGVHRSNLSRLLQGDVSRFALGCLVDMAAAAGIEVEVTIRDEIAREPAHVSSQIGPLPELSPRDQSKHLYAAGCAAEADGIG